MLEKLGGRKFVFAILILMLAFILVILKFVEPKDFLDFIKWIAGIFITGNAVVDVAGMLKE